MGLRLTMAGVTRAAVALALGCLAVIAVFTITTDGNDPLVHEEKIAVKGKGAITKKIVKPPQPKNKPNKAVIVKKQPKKATPVPNVVPVAASGQPDNFPKMAKKFSKGVVQIMVVKAQHQWLAPHKPPIMEEVSGSGFFVENKHLGHLKSSK